MEQTERALRAELSKLVQTTPVKQEQHDCPVGNLVDVPNVIKSETVKQEGMRDVQELDPRARRQ
eukprot:1582399-Karenia_brevis.AAC.1